MVFPSLPHSQPLDAESPTDLEPVCGQQGPPILLSPLPTTLELQAYVKQHVASPVQIPTGSEDLNSGSHTSAEVL